MKWLGVLTVFLNMEIKLKHSEITIKLKNKKIIFLKKI